MASWGSHSRTKQGAGESFSRRPRAEDSQAAHGALRLQPALPRPHSRLGNGSCCWADQAVTRLARLCARCQGCVHPCACRPCPRPGPPGCPSAPWPRPARSRGPATTRTRARERLGRDPHTCRPHTCSTCRPHTCRPRQPAPLSRDRHTTPPKWPAHTRRLLSSTTCAEPQAPAPTWMDVLASSRRSLSSPSAAWPVVSRSSSCARSRSSAPSRRRAAAYSTADPGGNTRSARHGRTQGGPCTQPRSVLRSPAESRAAPRPRSKRTRPPAAPPPGHRNRPATGVAGALGDHALWAAGCCVARALGRGPCTRTRPPPPRLTQEVGGVVVEAPLGGLDALQVATHGLAQLAQAGARRGPALGQRRQLRLDARPAPRPVRRRGRRGQRDATQLRRQALRLLPPRRGVYARRARRRRRRRRRGCARRGAGGAGRKRLLRAPLVGGEELRLLVSAVVLAVA
jgi:hypothetical protein